MAESTRRARGILDTSVVIDLEQLDPVLLPVEWSISAITLAELSAGPHAARTLAERAARQDRLQRLQTAVDAIPFDDAAARAFGRVYAAVVGAGRKARGPRSMDLLIAATACAEALPLFTRNPADLVGLEGVVDVIAV